MASKCRVHKYHRRKFSSTKVWACALPDCSHFMPKHLEDLIEGKRSICHSCGEEFILDKNSLKDDNPNCDDCRFGARTETVIPVSDVILGYISGKEPK